MGSGAAMAYRPLGRKLGRYLTDQPSEEFDRRMSEFDRRQPGRAI